MEPAYQVVPVSAIDVKQLPQVAAEVSKLAAARRSMARYPSRDELRAAIRAVATKYGEDVTFSKPTRATWRVDLFGLSIQAREARGEVACSIPRETADLDRVVELARVLSRVAGPQIVLDDSDDDYYFVADDVAKIPRAAKRRTTKDR